MRKIILLVALLSAGVAQAKSWYIPNEAGGQIVITDEECWYKGKEFASLHRAYARTRDGTVYNGCWYYKDRTVRIVYEMGGEKIHLIDDFSELQ